MNLIQIAQAITVIPELVRDTFTFIWWNHGVLVERLAGYDIDLVDDDEEEPDEGDEPLPMTVSGRIALELVMITRGTHNDPKQFDGLMQEVLPAMDSPQHAVDVALTLAAMVSTVAEDEDLERFGKAILHHEAAHS